MSTEEPSPVTVQQRAGHRLDLIMRSKMQQPELMYLRQMPPVSGWDGAFNGTCVCPRSTHGPPLRFPPQLRQILRKASKSSTSSSEPGHRIFNRPH